MNTDGKRIETKDFSYDSHTGLTSSQVDQMRRQYGKNSLTPPVRRSWWFELIDKFEDPTIRILLVAAGVSVAITAAERYGLGNTEVSFLDSIGIIFAVMLATLVGFFSERKSAREFELLNKVKDDISVKVLRDGQIGMVSIADLVTGDIVRIDPGDKVPADGVVIESMGLYVDQSMLTGESVPARKSNYMLPTVLSRLIATLKPGDDSFVARGSMVADGYGLFLVTAVGDRTQMGQIAGALSAEDESKSETPLTAKLSQLARQISVVGISGAIAIFTVMAVAAVMKSGLLAKLGPQPFPLSMITIASVFGGVLLTRYLLKPFFASMGMKITSGFASMLTALPMMIAVFAVALGIWEIMLPGADQTGIGLLKQILLAFVVAVTIIVVAVPEGLPMMVTVSLAMNMMKMARQNCLVRKLVASETIGSATVICTDKTGTLTENRMVPVRIFAEGCRFDRDAFEQLKAQSVWNWLVDGIAVNSQANLHVERDLSTGIETVTGVGNPTECALLKFLHEHEIDYLQRRESFTRLHEVGHNSQRKMSIVVAQSHSGNKTICFLKGAPERVLAQCSTIWINGQAEPIEPWRDKIDAAGRAASNDALRVLALSQCECGNEPCRGQAENNPDHCLTCSNRCFIALVGIADPIRPEVVQAAQMCREAHVQVKMITGDALPTAVAIARAAGIYSDGPNEKVMTSEQFAAVSEEELPAVAQDLRVLARSTPMDKLRLVKALHKQGEVVAMTGDGTNDAPALKYADVGLSMGITGTEVAKEASDIVLVDDNFRSIVTGVWWGRTLFQNIQRFLQFQLSVNAVALGCALLGPLVGVALPLTVTQLLWINIIMDTFAALAYSTDPPRAHTMKEKPVPRQMHIITPTMGISILVVSIYQIAILFAALYGGWFMAPEQAYNFAVTSTDPNYLKENLQALTVFFTILVAFQFWHKFNCRALRRNESPFELLSKNRLFIGIIATITVVQVLMVQSHTVGRFFRTTPLEWLQWGEIMLLTATVIPVAWFGRNLGYWLGLHK